MADKREIKIGVLSSFTLNQISDVFGKKCELLKLQPSFYFSPYNQYTQEILNPDSGIYKFQPEIIFLVVDIRTLLSDTYCSPYQKTAEERKKQSENTISDFINLISALAERSGAKIVVNNFEAPKHSPLGFLESKEEYGIIEMVRDMNFKLMNNFRKDGQVFIFDYDLFIGRLGRDFVFDEKMYYLADMKVSPLALPNLVDEYCAYIKAMKSLSKKCLVLDLDNTLWGGVVGEDGFDGIKLGRTVPGNVYMDFQKAILNLFERGIILAINSKNNPEDALKVIREHPDMLIREKHIAAMRINWQDKVSNLRSIAEELNIGIDSMVFIDDDKMNRALMREMCPEVLTVEMPDDPALYVRTLNEINDFNTMQLTKEDKKRGQMYVEQRHREELKSSATNLDEFLKKLEIVVEIENVNEFNIPRISQLTQKTNQFNITTRRYHEEDIKRFHEDPNYSIYAINVQDKFGDNGLTGVAIVKKENTRWEVDSFLLSCRVLGRGVENALLARIAEDANKSGVMEVVGQYIPSVKNKPAFDYFKDFIEAPDEEKSHEKEHSWRLLLSEQKIQFPEWVKLN